MTLYFIVVADGTPRFITLRAATLLANADVVIADVETLDYLQDCVGHNAEQIALVEPQSIDAYQHELYEAVARHCHDEDAVIVHLVRETATLAKVTSVDEVMQGISASLKVPVAYEVIQGVTAVEPEDSSNGIALPRMGPLVGTSVIVTRARHQASQLADELLRAGASPIVIPVIDIEITPEVQETLEQTLRNADPPSWVVFSSQNAVWSVINARGGRELLDQVHIACIGPATASSCVSAGFTVDFVPSKASPETFVSEFPAPRAPGIDRVVFFAGESARPIIDEGLRGCGYLVDRVIAYQTVRSQVSPYVRHRAHGADAIIFTSASAVSGAVAIFGANHLPSRIISIGPTTTAAIEGQGLVVTEESQEQRLDALVSTLVSAIERPR